MLRKISRWLISIIVSFWFVFALVSGAESFGGGIRGIIMNSPNAIPWLLLIFLVYLVWKKEMVGGVLILIFAVISFFFLKTWQDPIVFSLITLPLLFCGLVFVGSYFFIQKLSQE